VGLIFLFRELMIKSYRKEQAEMKRSLRQGGPADLNIYLGW